LRMETKPVELRDRAGRIMEVSAWMLEDARKYGWVSGIADESLVVAISKAREETEVWGNSLAAGAESYSIIQFARGSPAYNAVYKPAYAVSEKCDDRESLRKELKEKETIRKQIKEGPNMQEIIARLRREKAESEARAARAAEEKEDQDQRDSEAAKVAGVEWAKGASYDDLKEMVSSIERLESADPHSRASADLQLSQKLERILGGRVNTRRYGREWQTGVLEFWKEVESQL